MQSSTPRDGFVRFGVVLAAAAVVVLVVLAAMRFTGPDTAESRDSVMRYLAAGELDQAREAAAALAGDDEHTDVRDLLSASTLIRSGRPDLALRALSRLDQSGADRKVIQLLIGEALYAAGRFAEAEVFFSTVAAEHPSDAYAHRWLASTYYDLGAYDAAIAAMDVVIELDPGDYRPHRLLGMMYADFELTEQAVRHYETALTLNPPAEIAEEVSLGLAEMKLEQRDYPRIRELLSSIPVSARQSLLLALAEWNLGNHQQASELLQQAESLGAADPKSVLLRSELLSLNGDDESAVRVLAGAVERFPYSAEIRYEYALSLQQQGEEAAAEQQMTRWRDLSELATRLTELNLQAISDPLDAEVRDRLAEVCEALGRTELAAMWRTAAESCRQRTVVTPGQNNTPSSHSAE